MGTKHGTESVQFPHIRIINGERVDEHPVCGTVNWKVIGQGAHRAWRCKTCTTQKAKNWRKRIKEQVIQAYGGACACCGIERRVFLALDHVNNDGAVQRREFGARSGWKTYIWAYKNGYPDTLQLLCHNCNTAKQLEDNHTCERQ